MKIRLRYVLILVFLLIVVFIISFSRYPENPDVSKDNDLDQSITKGINYLLNNKNGLFEVLISDEDNNIFMIWESFNALYALKAFNNSYSQDIEEAILQNYYREDGSFGYFHHRNLSFFCLETEAQYLFSVESDLTSNHILANQNNISYFELNSEIYSGSESYISVLGYAFLGLYCNNFSNEIDNSNRIPDYLEDNQNRYSNWGTEIDFYDTPFYATEVLIPMLSILNHSESKLYNDIIKFILLAQKPSGAFYNSPFENYFLYNIKTNNKIIIYRLSSIGQLFMSKRPSVELRTSLALNSLLLSSNPKQYESQIEKGISYLLSKQKEDGSWEGGYFIGTGKKEDIYTTSKVLKTFYLYKQYLQDADNVSLCLT